MIIAGIPTYIPIFSVIIDKPNPIQNQALSTLQEIVLGDKFEKTQSTILNLIKKTTDANIQNLCKETCEKLGMFIQIKSEDHDAAGGTKEDSQIPKILAKTITIEADNSSCQYL